MKEIGEAKECIGIQISATNKKIELSQGKYIEQILKHFDMLNCKPAKTPGNPNEKLSVSMVNEENDLTGKVPFQELVGCVTTKKKNVIYIHFQMRIMHRKSIREDRAVVSS